MCRHLHGLPVCTFTTRLHIRKCLWKVAQNMELAFETNATILFLQCATAHLQAKVIAKLNHGASEAGDRFPRTAV